MENLIGGIFTSRIFFINYLSYGILFAGLLGYYFYQKEVRERHGKTQLELRYLKEDLDDQGMAIEEIRNDPRYIDLREQHYRSKDFRLETLAFAAFSGCLWSFGMLAIIASFLEGCLAYVINN